MPLLHHGSNFLRFLGRHALYGEGVSIDIYCYESKPNFLYIHYKAVLLRTERARDFFNLSYEC